MEASGDAPSHWLVFGDPTEEGRKGRGSDESYSEEGGSERVL